jgi:glycosyltransferase involved in cell wall biosynthesis
MAMISRFPPALAVTVIVPVYKGGHDFRLCLEGISGLSPAAGEIIVVIDGEDNGEGLVAEVAGVTLIRLPVRSGPAAARNAGARAAGGDLLVFLDADTVPTSDLIARIRHNFDDDPGL